MTELSEYSTRLESHYYGLNGSAIKYTTRNICADATAKILEEMARILFPNEEIEIYVIPAKDGCHQDNFWIKFKNVTNNATFATVVCVCLTAYLGQPLTKATINYLEANTELAKKQATQIKEKIEQVMPHFNISDEQCKSLVESTTIKKNRNTHFEQLRTDKEIKKEKFIAKSNGKIVTKKTIESIDFSDYIEDLPKTTTIKTIEKIHELIVVKPVNDKANKHLMWDVEDKNIRKKYGVRMKDEGFYEFYFQKNIKLKTLVARVRYTVKEYEEGEEKIDKKEVVIVYKYNGKTIYNLPKNENIEPFPLESSIANKNEYVIIEEKESSQKIDEKQISLF